MMMMMMIFLLGFFFNLENGVDICLCNISWLWTDHTVFYSRRQLFIACNPSILDFGSEWSVVSHHLMYYQVLLPFAYFLYILLHRLSVLMHPELVQYLDSKLSGHIEEVIMRLMCVTLVPQCKHQLSALPCWLIATYWK